MYKLTLFASLFLFVSCFTSAQTQSYVLNFVSNTPYSTDGHFNIQRVNLSTLAESNVGDLTSFTNVSDISTIYYDAAGDQLVGIGNNYSLFRYNLTTHEESLTTIGSESYRCLIVGESEAYLLNFVSNTPYSTDGHFKIQRIDLSTAEVTDISDLTSFTNVSEISNMYYDAAGDQLVGIGKNYSLFRYNLTTHEESLTTIGSEVYRCLIMAGSGAYLLNFVSNTPYSTDGHFKIQSIDLSTAGVTDIGDLTRFNNVNDISAMYYDAAGNQLVGIAKVDSLFRYSLSTHQESLTKLNSGGVYRGLTVNNESSVTAIVNPVNEKDKTISKIYRLQDGVELKEIEYNHALIILYSDGSREKVFYVTK